jgi:hypothetical protein
LLGRVLGFGRVPGPSLIFSLDEFEEDPVRLRCARFSRGGGRRGSRAASDLTLEFLDQVTVPDALLARGPLGSMVREPAAFAGLVRSLLRSAGPKPSREATLLLPESWLRLVMVESGPLPKAAAARDEVLRFRLRRLVPYRVEDLRLSAVEAAVLPGQQEPRRLAIGFAGETVLSSFESAFGEAGLRLGMISVPSLALFAGVRGVHRIPGVEVGVVARRDDYALWVRRDDELVLHRQRSFPGDLPGDARENLARRELSLVKGMFEAELAGETLGRILLHARDESAVDWSSWLGEIFGRAPQLLSREHLPLAAGAAAAALAQGAQDVFTLAGAACLEVA